MNTFFQNFQLLLSYPFVQKALIAGPLIAVCSALLGVTLVTSKRTMIGDGLSHVSFCAVAVALAAGIAPMALSIPTVIISAVLILRGKEHSDSEASIALFSGGALAVGTFVLSAAKGMNMDVSDYMFGSMFTLTNADTLICIVCSILVVICYFILYRRIFAVNFDGAFASTIGINTGKYSYITAVFTAVTIVIGMKFMGVMLVTALTAFPTLAAIQVCKSYRTTTVFAAVASIICFMTGLIISLFASTPAGATVVLAYFSLLIICCGLKRVQNGIYQIKSKQYKLN